MSRLEPVAPKLHPPEPASVTPLRDLIERRLDQRWLTWSQRHPHLAAAIDRVSLTEQTVARLRGEPAFVEAMRRADLDEARLAEAERLLAWADRWIDRAIGL